MNDERNEVVGRPRCRESPDAIAHDLRNLLMAVDSNVALARDLRDDGPGVPHGELDRIFDAGFSTKADGHAGLGLATVRAIVEAHGGTVAVDPRQGGGSTFVVRLPALPGRRRSDGPPDGPCDGPRFMTAAG